MIINPLILFKRFSNLFCILVFFVRTSFYQAKQYFNICKGEFQISYKLSVSKFITFLLFAFHVSFKGIITSSCLERL